MHIQKEGQRIWNFDTRVEVIIEPAIMTLLTLVILLILITVRLIGDVFDFLV